jgi:hypothetical protein
VEKRKKGEGGEGREEEGVREEGGVRRSWGAHVSLIAPV